MGAATGSSSPRVRYPFGAYEVANELWFSESWNHRVAKIERNGPAPYISSVIDRLPAYPSRMSPAVGAGMWLTCFTARRRLVEFVLREDRFRRMMMEEVDPRFWVAPMLSSGRTFLEPLQGGNVKTLGISKPWAPPRSYGLVVRLGPDGSAEIFAAQPRGWASPRHSVGGRGQWVSLSPLQRRWSSPSRRFGRIDGKILVVSDYILELRNATKKYAGVPAIEDVSIGLRRGEVHALLGENGAGKSTLTKIMAGVVHPSSGSLHIEGQLAEPRTPHDAQQMGVAMVFQETSLVPTMTVAQNLFLGHEKVFNQIARDQYRRPAVPAVAEL